MKKILTLLLFCILAFPPAVWAMHDGIVAVVNDDVITETNVSNRVQLTLREMGQEPTSPEAMEILRQRVLRTLVDESLQNQFAQSRGIAINPNDLQRAANVMEQTLGLNSGQYMATIGAELENTAQEKLAAEMRWHKIVRGFVMPQVDVSTVEIDRMIEDMLTNEMKTRVKIAQIFLPTDTDAPQLRLVDIKSDLEATNATFADLARQYSEGPAAQNGGDMGWFDEAELHPKLFNAAVLLQPGEVSEPIQTEGGWHLIQLIEKDQASRMPAKSEPHYRLQKIALPLAAATSAAQAELAALAEQRLDETEVKTITNRIMTNHADIRATAPEWRKISQMPDKAKDAVQKTQPGATTPVIEAENEQIVYFVAEKRVVVPEEMQAMRTKVRERITANRRTLRARQFMRELRADAYIDIRTE